jgi:hypothetical protein
MSPATQASRGAHAHGFIVENTHSLRFRLPASAAGRCTTAATPPSSAPPPRRGTHATWHRPPSLAAREERAPRRTEPNDEARAVPIVAGLRTLPPGTPSHLGRRGISNNIGVRRPFVSSCFLAEGLTQPMHSHRHARLGVQPHRDRRTVDPAELDVVWCLPLHRQ